MSRPRVFVSHSSGSDRALLEAVCTALEASDDGYEVLVDYRDIHAGDQWRERIHAWLAECDAAAILFSPRAVRESPWVLKEATILAWRRALEPGFKLVPVRLADVKSDEIAGGRWSPLLLGEVQAAKTGDADEITQAIRTALGRITRAKTPLDQLTLAVADLLAQVPDRTLETACRTHFDHVGWLPREDRKQRFSELIARKIFRDGIQSLTNAVTILDSMHVVLDADTAARIVDTLAPFWVEPEAAAQIPGVASHEHTDRDVAMNGQQLYDFTADMYLRRAYPLSQRWRLIPVEDANPDDFVGHVANSVHQWVRERIPILRRQTPDKIDEFLNRKSEHAFFILMPTLPPDEAALQAIRDRYRRATFIFATGDTLPDCAALLPRVRCLVPPLTLEDETEAFFAYANATEFVDRLRRS